MKLGQQEKQELIKMQAPLFSMRGVNATSDVTDQKRQLKLLQRRLRKHRSGTLILNANARKFLYVLSGTCPLDGRDECYYGSDCARCLLRALNNWRSATIPVSLLQKKVNKALKAIDKSLKT